MEDSVAQKSILPKIDESTSNSNTYQQQEKSRHVIQLVRIKQRHNIIDLAKKVGSTADLLSAYERGESVLPNEVLVKVCHELAIDMKTIM